MSAEADFLEWAELDRERSQHTMVRYRATLDSLRVFADPATATVAQVEEWWKSRYGAASGTRANELACLRTFYKYCTAFDVRIDDPTRRLFAPKVPVRVPRMIGRTDFERLLGELTADEPELRRAYALGGYGGLRISEAATLQWRDIDQEARRMFVTGKGNKERPVPLSPTLLDYLLPVTGGSVVAAGGKPPNSAVLQRRINRHMKRHGIDHTFHDLRKRGASIALSKGASPVAVRTMFGWASMETVSHYAVVGNDELDRIAEMLT